MKDVVVKSSDNPVHLPPKSLNSDIVDTTSCYKTTSIDTSPLNHKPCNLNIFDSMVTPHTQRQSKGVPSIKYRKTVDAKLLSAHLMYTIALL